MNSGTVQDLYSVAFPDNQHGWATTDSGTVLHTSDGGTTWLPQTSGTNRQLFGVAFTDSSTGWVVGAGGTILHTTDGGTLGYPRPMVPAKTSMA